MLVCWLVADCQSGQTASKVSLGDAGWVGDETAARGYLPLSLPLLYLFHSAKRFSPSLAPCITWHEQHALIIARLHPASSLPAGTGRTLRLCYLRHAYGLGEHYESVVPNLAAAAAADEEEEEGGDEAAATEAAAEAAAE